MYISLYRKYRPQTFSDMVGQSAAVSVLQRSLKEDKLGHAYLFSGPRGCGKTSAARLVAKTLNCSNPTDDCEPCGTCANCVSIAMGEHLDVIEIDGASNRGIGEIRDLKSHVNLKPLSSPHKVYIIDEVHMLTEAAFNALLKTLEEPPANVVFLLATTEPHKVPVTIRSRCQHIPFHRISIEDMVARIRFVAAGEELTVEDEALWEIARQADGALRDALSLMEQAVALGKGSLTLLAVTDLMGGSSRGELEKWVTQLRTEPQQAASTLAEMLARGVSLERITESFFVVFRDLWIYRAWGEKGAEAVEASNAELSFLQQESKHWNVEQLRSACSFFAKLLPRTRYGLRQEVFSGLVMITLTNILEGRAESSVQSGHAQPAPPKQPPSPPRESRPSPAPAQTMRRPVQAGSLPWDEGFDDLVARPQNRTQNSEKTTTGPDRPSPLIDIASELGEDVFSKLIAETGPKALAFGAALLHAEILSDEEKVWRFVFEKSPSYAESFLNTPQNRKIFAAAAHKIWGIGAPEETEVQDEPQNAVVQSRLPQHDLGAKKEIKGDLGTLLKRMGAEVLYVQDKHSQEDQSEEHEA